MKVLLPFFWKIISSKPLGQPRHCKVRRTSFHHSRKDAVREQCTSATLDSMVVFPDNGENVHAVGAQQVWDGICGIGGWNPCGVAGVSEKISFSYAVNLLASTSMLPSYLLRLLFPRPLGLARSYVLTRLSASKSFWSDLLPSCSLYRSGDWRNCAGLATETVDLSCLLEAPKELCTASAALAARRACSTISNVSLRPHSLS